MRVRMRIVRVRLCVLRVLAGGRAVNNLKTLFDGLAAVGAVYCLAALIRMIGGM